MFKFTVPRFDLREPYRRAPPAGHSIYAKARLNFKLLTHLLKVQLCL